MLSSFKIKNFKSILEETVCLEYGEGKAPNGYKKSEIIPFLEVDKIRLVPCLMFLGANASGKSNILEAFSVFNRVIFHGIGNFFIPNKLNCKFAATSFELDFFIARNKYKYVLEYNNEQIVNEILKKNNDALYEINTNKNTNFQKIENKGYSKIDFQNLLEAECCIIKDNTVLQRYAFLPKFCTKYPGLNEFLMEACDYFQSKIKVYRENKFHPSWAIDELARGETEEAVQSGFHRIAELLRKLDIDIEEFVLNRTIEEFTGNNPISNDYFKIDQRKMKVTADDITAKLKDINGKIVDFKLAEQSLGTQLLFGLLGRFLSSLDNGEALIIDELDSSLHPLLFKQLIRLFKDKRYNKHNAQLIFSTHTTDILDDDIIRVSEVGIVSKTLKNGTTVTRLSEFENIRNVNNFRKQYLEGRFSGIPFSYV